MALVGGLDLSKTAKVLDDGEAGVTKIQYGLDGSSLAVIRHQPFGVEFHRNGEAHVAFNRRGLLNVEHWRPKRDASNATDGPSEDESTWWEESFGGNTDSKPRGPESVGLDISFPGYGHVFGIPEHTGPFSLRETRSITLLECWQSLIIWVEVAKARTTIPTDSTTRTSSSTHSIAL